jgi:hypothetical protein
MVDSVRTQKDIPTALYYVCSNDTFMSGWGYAQGLINTLIFPCDSYDEAKKVMEHAEGRSDQNWVRLCGSKPKLRAGHFYQVKTKVEYPHWYGME